MRFLECFTMDLDARHARMRARGLLRRYYLSLDYRVVVWYRMARWFRSRQGLGRAGRAIALSILRRLSLSPGVEINCADPIGPGFTLRHAHDIVVGEGVRVGRNVTLYNGVTLGARRLRDLDGMRETDERYPTIEDNVTIFSGAKVLGPVTIGAGSTVGANAVVLDSCAADSTIAGVPARVIRRGDAHLAERSSDGRFYEDTSLQ